MISKEFLIVTFSHIAKVAKFYLAKNRSRSTKGHNLNKIKMAKSYKVSVALGKKSFKMFYHIWAWKSSW